MRDGKIKSLLRKAWRKFSHQSLFVKYFLIFNLIVYLFINRYTTFIIYGNKH